MVRNIKTPVLIKLFSVFLFVLLLSSYINTIAEFNGTPYSPGATLDPECAPTDPNCKVEINSGDASPWLTSSSGIYHNGNVNVGSDTASVSAQINGGITINTNTIGPLGSSSLDMIPSITINNSGNPVITYYTTALISNFNFVKPAEASGNGSSLNIIVCSDPACTTSTSNVIDSGFTADSNAHSYQFVKVGSDNFPRVSYLADGNIKYAICNDEECSDPDIETITSIINGWDYIHSLALDESNHPYIIYDTSDQDTGNYTISLARYTGTGTEDTCISSFYQGWDDVLQQPIYTYETNSNWKCSVISSSLNGDSYLEQGIGDLIYIDQEDGFIRFMSTYYDYDLDSYSINYSICNDVDCSNPIRTPIDETNSTSDIYAMSVNSSGVPYIAYSNDDDMTIKLAYYVGDGNGTGCSETDDWTCSVIFSMDDDYTIFDNNLYSYYWNLDMKIDRDGYPRISIFRYIDDPESYSLLYVKCNNTTCSDSTETELLSLGSGLSDAYYLSGPFVIDENNQANFVYIDAANEDLKFTKEVISNDTIFNPNGDDFFTFGDVGIKGNLFIDGNIISQAGIYLNESTPDNESNLLYNNNGDLYWNGELVNATYTPQWTDTYTYGGVTLTVPETSGTIATTNGSVNYATSAGSTTTASTANTADLAYVANQLNITRSIYGNNFNGTASLTQVINSTYGGTGNGFTKFTGPLTSEKTFTLPNASATILTSNSAVTVGQGGTGLTTLTANNLMVGNGTGNVTFIAPGESGNVLTSNGTNWTSVSPMSHTLSSILASTSTNTINNASYQQEWQWNTLAGGTGLKLSSTSTAAASNTQKIFEVANSGANTTSTQTTYSGYFTNTKTGESSTNVAGYFSASGATNNYSAIFANGNVGIGTTTPTAYLNIKAGTATAGTAPLKLTSGTNLSTTEAGAIEYDGTHLYFTATNGGTRYQLDQQAVSSGVIIDVSTITSGVSGRVLYNNSGVIGEMTTSGSGTQLALTTSPVFTTPSIGVATATSINNLPLSQNNTDFNVKVGQDAGLNLVAGAQYNTFIGYQSGLSSSTLSTNAADQNTAIGYHSLYSNTTGTSNVSIGSNSLYSNTTGHSNNATGESSLFSNTTGIQNTATGHWSLYSNTSGSNNTANGHWSLYSNTTGHSNNATGESSLFSNTTGYQNTATGYGSLFYNTTGHQNTATGYYSLNSNIIGYYNTANGQYSLYNIGKEINSGSLTTGLTYTIILAGTTNFTICGASNSVPGTVFIHNGTPCTGTGTAVGDSYRNVGDGYQSGRYIADDLTELTISSNSIFIGSNTKALQNNSSNEIVIGYNTIGNGSNTTTIGTGNVLYIGGSSITGKVARFTNSSGYCDINPLTTSLSCSSDISLKKNITTLDKEKIDFVLRQNIEVPEDILGKINTLTPVTYNWNTEEDGDLKHIGFIAQEVEQIFPDLVFTDKEKIDPITGEGLKSVAYSNFIPYTIKAIQEMDLKIKDINSLELNNNSSFSDILNSFFVDVVEKVEDGVAYLTGLTIGSQEKRTGITLYDEETGEPYCISISNGEMVNKQGECKITEVPDVCPNIDEYQTEVPEGYNLDENNECVEVLTEEGSSEGEGADVPPLIIEDTSKDTISSGTQESE